MSDDTELLALLDAVDNASANARPEYVLQRYEDEEYDGNWPCFYRIGTNDSAKALAHVVFEEDADFIALARTAAPILATKVRELLAENERWDNLWSLHKLGAEHSAEVNSGVEESLRAERDQLKEQLAEYRDIIDAALAWHSYFAKRWEGCEVEGEPVMMGQPPERDLFDAVDVLRPRKATEP